MIEIYTFSGGKDSLGILCKAKESGRPFEVVFCDTGWESEKTYKHIEDIEVWLGQKFARLRSNKFLDLIDLFIKKGRSASTKARFCTEEMKVKPMIDYILSLNDDVVVYQGVRADESQSRSLLKESDEYFKFYFEPYGYDKKNKPKFHTYRKKDVIAYCDKYSVDVKRPILKYSAEMVFDLIFSHGLKPNPLYYEGFSRVGCFPCIMCRHDEIRLVIEKYSDRIDKIREFEKTLGRTFFPPKYIPERYCTHKTISKKNKVVMCPTIDDVVNYLTSPHQETMFKEEKYTGCISVYNICETI